MLTWALELSHTCLQGQPSSLQRDARNFSFPVAFWPECWLIVSGDLTLSDTFIPSPFPAPFSSASLEASMTAVFTRMSSPPPPPFVHNDAAFLTFAHGPMNCVGKNIGILEIPTVPCALLQRFDMKLRDDAFERRCKDYSIATRPEVPVVHTR